MQKIKTASDKFWRDVNGMMATEAFLVLLFMIGLGRLHIISCSTTAPTANCGTQSREFGT